MPDAAAHWDRLHENPRFRPMYPNENVVRFLISNRTRAGKAIPPRFLDIGVGAGRHIKLATELGFKAYGVDLSLVGLQYAYQRLSKQDVHHSLAQASMNSLPFVNSSFDIVLSYGVFYYGTVDETKQSIAEAHRVLAEAGKLFVVLRTTEDYRFGKGERLGHNTFQLRIEETNEYATVQHFLAEEDIPRYFAAFSHTSYEKTETTFSNHSRLNSDWLITAEK
ncbi:MAG TPA: class I SAM-dependent methyltransferase [Terriglobales bacterium]|nr:class I SAM-dependent methyltransferase [Terriglobales bacterium]